MTKASFARISRRHWRHMWRGARAAGPLLPGVTIFGLAFGALVREAGLPAWVGPLGSGTVVAGAAQIAILEQIFGGAPLLIAVATGLVINARMALYSAAVAPMFADYPRRWKFGLAFFLTDQAAITMLNHADEHPHQVRRRWFGLGVGISIYSLWMIGTAAGVLLGPVLPAAWQIGVIVPLMFLAVMVPRLHAGPPLLAIAVSVTVVLALRDLPLGLNVLTGAVAGIAAGALLPPKASDAGARDVEES